MPGYSLLPTLAKPVSPLTMRLSSEQMKERNDWIRGAHAHGSFTAEEIATQVGLTVQRVKQIIIPSPSQRPKAAKQVKSRKFKTPRDAAVAEFMANSYHMMSDGKCDHFSYSCNSCFGSLMILESEYDANGWPYSWAMRGQERFIEACS